MAAIHYIRQKEARGLGHAVATSELHVGGAPFAVLLGDDIVAATDPLLERMIEVYERYGRSVIAVQEVPREDIHLYGAIKPEWVEDDLARVVDIVEKPKKDPPSNLAAIGRYVLTPEIFDALRETKPGAGGEIQLTDAIGLLASEQTVYAFRFDGGRYDIGKKLDYIRATVEMAVDREDLGPEVRAFLADLVQRKKLV
jgi:UTP--glucose-1-phosphate uridylyltransferase